MDQLTFHDELFQDSTKEERAELLAFYEGNRIARKIQKYVYDELKLFIQTNDN